VKKFHTARTQMHARPARGAHRHGVVAQTHAYGEWMMRCFWNKARAGRGAEFPGERERGGEWRSGRPYDATRKENANANAKRREKRENSANGQWTEWTMARKKEPHTFDY